MNRSTNKENGLLPIVAVFSAMAGPLLFILGLAFGSNLGEKDALIGGSISDWLTASATVAVTALTFVLAKESWQLRLLQVAQLRELQIEGIRPNISVTLEGSHVGMNFMNAKIANMGKGIARNVKFSLFDRTGNDLHQGTDAVADRLYKLAIFRKGIESIGINQVISSYVFNFHELSTELNGKIFEPYICIKVSFQDIEGNAYINEFTIDFSEFEGITEIEGSPIYKLSTEVKKIREQLQKSLKTSNDRLNINVYTEDERIREREELLQWVKEKKARAAQERSDPNDSLPNACALQPQIDT